VTVMIFDGDCGFCSACVRWGYRNLGRMPESIPFQAIAVADYGLTLEQVKSAVWLIEPGRQHRGHLAVAALLALQPERHWRFLGGLMRAPILSGLASLGYRLVVRFRHRLPGATEACAMPAKNAPAQKAPLD
jgi:predicted DCC family thiol-disulfide oxidoreductase YuxK